MKKLKNVINSFLLGSSIVLIDEKNKVLFCGKSCCINSSLFDKNLLSIRKPLPLSLDCKNIDFIVTLQV